MIVNNERLFYDKKFLKYKLPKYFETMMKVNQKNNFQSSNQVH